MSIYSFFDPFMNLPDDSENCQNIEEVDYNNMENKYANMNLVTSSLTNLWDENDELIGTGVTIQYSTGPSWLEGEIVRRRFMCTSPWENDDQIVFEFDPEMPTFWDAILVRPADPQKPVPIMQAFVNQPQMMIDLFEQHRNYIDAREDLDAYDILAHIYMEEADGKFKAYCVEET